MAAEIEKKLDALICGPISESLSTHTVMELRLLLAQGDTVPDFKKKSKSVFIFSN